jgi:hypothetical protein
VVSTDRSRSNIRREVQGSFVGRPSLCDGLRFLRMTAWGGWRGRDDRVNGRGQGCPPCMFCLDLALRYFVSFLYNLDGFMEPLRTGLSEGAFCVLGECRGEEADPSASLGMTTCWRMTVFLR